MKREGFSGRFALILAALGMAIGAGNLWRFPRIAAQYGTEQHGCGAFILLWLVFLLAWSIPIMMCEFTLGKVTRRGPIGAFSSLLGRQTAWMGAFVGFTTLMIACYYSVVTGWTAKYFVKSFGGFPELPAAANAEAIQANYKTGLAIYNEFAHTPEALGWHLGMVVLAALVVWRGVKTGVELLCKILIPSLFLLLVGGVFLVFKSDDGGGAIRGLNYLFDPNWNQLWEKPNIWIDALAQSAWSTGAGWGLILAYGAYARRNEDAVVNNATAAMGNNFASVLVGLFLFPAMFSILGSANLAVPDIRAALTANTDNSTGMVFQYIPFIFKNVPEYGSLLTIIFFGGLFIAAFSSLIAMYEMGCRIVQDMGASRHVAVMVISGIVGGVGCACALNQDLFQTMDWVWGVGLIVSGLMIAWAVQLYGVDRYRQRLINDRGADLRLPWVFNWLFVFLIPAQGVALLWWFLKSGAEGDKAWAPFELGSFNAGTCVWWWAATLTIFIVLSPWLGRWSLREAKTDEEEDTSTEVAS